MNKIFESDLIFKIFLINELKRKEFMNQYKFSGVFVEEITKQIDSTNKESEKQNNQEVPVKLSNLNLIFEDKNKNNLS